MASWRDLVKVHPAADLFPMMGELELAALALDIEKHGMQTLPVFLGDQLLDGRNRIAALDLIGGLRFTRAKSGSATQYFHVLRWAKHDKGVGIVPLPDDTDPYVYVVSANIQRRHLTGDQKRDLIAALLRANPTKSDRQIAAAVKASPTTVGTVRHGLEKAGDVSKLDTRTDTIGREQPATKPPVTPVLVAVGTATANANEALRLASEALSAIEPFIDNLNDSYIDAIVELALSNHTRWLNLANELRRNRKEHRSHLGVVT